MQKRIICIIIVSFFAIFLVVGIVGQIRLQSATEDGFLIENCYPVRVYLYNEQYAVVLYRDNKPVCGAFFTSDRKASSVVYLKLVEIENVQSYLGKTEKELKKKFGQAPTDIGSGFPMPSYITSDGHLVCFSLDNKSGVITHVGKTDLLTGESVEWYICD